MSGPPAQDPAALVGIQQPRQGFLGRFLSLRVGAMLVRNTVVSCFVFGIGIGLLWGLVTFAHVNDVVAVAVSFVVSNSLHYILGRSWIFRGTERDARTGYVLFIINACIGLVVTTGLYALLIALTGMNYLVARAFVSLVSGLIVFALNATFNFRQV